LEFVVGAAASFTRQALAVMTFRQKLLEIAGPLAVGPGEPSIARRRQNGARVGIIDALVAERQCGALRIAYVVPVERDAQHVAVPRAVSDRARLPASRVQ